MQEILKLQQKIVPEIMEQLEKRYRILRTIYYNQPVGRRVLANNVGLGERIVRTEISFLKDQNLIEINTPGMSITHEGEEIINKLKDFIHDLKGLSELEQIIKNALGLREVIIVPGNLDEDKTVVNELGRLSAGYLRSILKDNSTIALTGGTTIKEMVDNMPKISSIKNLLVVPARGGMGRKVEIQANTLAANLSDKLGGSYKLLHVPDNLSNEALHTLINERDIKEVIENIHKSDVLIYGIGRADEMGRRRGLSVECLVDLDDIGAVGEAFGYYFNNEGKMVYSTPTIGVNREDIKKIKTRIAIAGGTSKGEAIYAIEVDNKDSVLITDEGAARSIIALINKKDKQY